MDDYTEAREYLERVRKDNQALTTLAEAERDELVIVAVQSKVTPDRPASLRVLVVDKNETLGGALLMDNRHQFSDFPIGFPCLRFDPAIIYENWPERHEIPEDDPDHLYC
jgi:hypothetical protein